MLFRFLLLASVALGALAPLSAEAKLRCGQASFYGHGDGFAGRTMANGRPMNPQAMITAHRSLPLGSKILVRNPANGKSVTVTVSDRGPWHGDRILDLSVGAFSRIASPSQGIARICMTKL
jgi:rare lipoprotein A